jgi:hypothetical protein
MREGVRVLGVWEECGGHTPKCGWRGRGRVGVEEGPTPQLNEFK